ncbi:hypothetical protein [Dokdonia donghaensis]|uniref:hypothetical protein n=1 Tax=Dokdonia donghaensis TaxID=326320 RepID=UPI001F3DEDD4|nr:hypothetical protein [Dokdonia donghaensis]
MYPIYRSYDKLDQMVNIVNVDSRFDLGDASQPINNKSYVGKIIVTEPYNLFITQILGIKLILILKRK